MLIFQYMKNRKPLSYYMGMSYRNTRRPSLEVRRIQTEASPDIKQFSSTFSASEGIIHCRKKSKVLTEPAQPSAQTPFQLREQEMKKRQLHQKNRKKDNNLSGLVKVCSLQAKQAEVEAHEEVPVVTISPAKSPQIKIDNSGATKKVILLQSEQRSSIFNHFPSDALLSPSSKLKAIFLNFRKQNFTERKKNSAVFFQKPSTPSGDSIRRKRSESRNFESGRKSVFNFDGTLQNHKLQIPQRPQTADNRKKSIKNEGIRSYTAIAKKCMTKSKRFSNNQLHLLPWNDSNDHRPDHTLEDISFSSINDNFKFNIQKPMLFKQAIK